MTPEEIRTYIKREFDNIHVEPLDEGYSFWLGRRQIKPYSTRILRVRMEGASTKLKRSASSIRDGKEHERSFTGKPDDLRVIFEEEREIVEEWARVDPKAPILRGAPQLPSFHVGQVYTRKHDINGPFGGNSQSGISTSPTAQAIFLFSGESGRQYGYRDHEEAGVFSYCGEGQVGDMRFVRGNAAVRDHATDGRALHLFKTTTKGKQTYLGEFAYASHEVVRGPDRNGDDRDVIVFHLVRVELVAESGPSNDADDLESGLTLAEARARAIQACAPRAGSSTSALRDIHYRSKAVKDYVLLRAGGQCESCREPAPFRTRRNKAYLEPHHTTRLSDGGLDHPEHVGAVCPNCHREIHHGADGHQKNEKLKDYVAVYEAELGRASTARGA